MAVLPESLLEGGGSFEDRILGQKDRYSSQGHELPEWDGVLAALTAEGQQEDCSKPSDKLRRSDRLDAHPDTGPGR